MITDIRNRINLILEMTEDEYEGYSDYRNMLNPRLPNNDAYMKGWFKAGADAEGGYDPDEDDD